MDKSAICRLVRIDWDTVGRIISRVCAEELDGERPENLFEIAIDEVSWKRRHNYLTLIADHIRGQIVWAPRATPRRRRIGSSGSSARAARTRSR